MIEWSTLLAVLAALLVAVGCTVLPGLVAATNAAVRGRRDRPSVLGPLFWYELTRLARRGQQPKLRAMYAGVLFVGLLVTYLSEFSEIDPVTLLFGGGAVVELDRTAKFAERFAATFLFCQLAVLILITPVYAGGAIPEERDRGTLDYLRTSLLSNREIVAAVLTARLVFVAGLVLAGLPILGLTTLFGGVGPDALLGGFAVALLTVLSTGTFSLWLGVRGRGLRDIVLWVYGVMGLITLFGACCWCMPLLGTSSPFTMTFLLLNPVKAMGGFANWADGSLAVFVLTHGIVAVVFTWRATVGVRLPPPAWRSAVGRGRARTPKIIGHSSADAPPQALPPRPALPPEPKHRRRERPPARAYRVPRLGATDPLLWKERFFSGRVGGLERGVLSGCFVVLLVVVLFPVGLWIFVAVTEYAANGRDPADILNPLVRVVGFAAALALAPAVGVRAAVSVARERQRQTLDALFSLPVRRYEVLRAKGLAPLYWVRFWFAGVLGVVLFAALFGAVHLVGLAVAVLMIAAFVLFADALGLLLSVRCKSATRAVTWLLGALFAAFLSPLLLSTLVRSFLKLAWPGDGDGVERVVESFSVPYAVYETLFKWDDPRRGKDAPEILVTGLAVTAAHAGLAWAFWLVAVGEFNREGK